MQSNPLWSKFEESMGAEPAKTALILIKPGLSVQRVTYRELRRDVSRAVRWLRTQGLRPRQVVAIDRGHSYETILAFLACLHQGAIPSIFARAAVWDDVAATQRLLAHAQSGGFEAILCSPEARASLASGPDALPNSIKLMSLPCAGELPRADCNAGKACLSDPAWIQYSSGTTGAPRGILLMRDAVINNVTTLARSMGFGPEGVSVGALPLFHDLGLVIQVVLPLLMGATSVLIPPRFWALRPSLLLKAVHTYRGTMTWMPNFGFAQCARVSNRDVAELDLSSWQIVGNGSEPGSLETIRRFVRRFTPYGLRPSVVRMGYGMAENVVAASLTPGPGQLKSLRIDQAALAMGHALPAKAPQGSVTIMSVGRPVAGTEIMIADDIGNQLADGHVGEILLRGSSLFRRYHRDDIATNRAFLHGWFRTGDLGFFADNQLYVTDRKKDLIIVGGLKMHPHLIEETVRSVAPDIVGEVVAFGRWNDGKGTEDAVVVHGLRRRISEEDRKGLAFRIRAKVKRELDLTLADVLIVHRSWIVKTTSGKVGRAANRAKYDESRRRSNPPADLVGRSFAPCR